MRDWNESTTEELLAIYIRNQLALQAKELCPIGVQAPCGDILP
jgi:hypothetical protein